MSSNRFTDAMWAEIAPTYRAILDLPFNRELAAGTLSRERFVFYMVQDGHYLRAFSRALAVAAAKADIIGAQVDFAKFAYEAIMVERAMHGDFFDEYGLSEDNFAMTRPSPTCAAYNHFLIATAHQYPFSAAAAALLPCFQIYHEVGKHLYGVAVPNNPYQKWIDTYRDEGGFGETVRTVLTYIDLVFDTASPYDRAVMWDTYMTAVRYEWMFWDSAYRMEAWPV